MSSMMHLKFPRKRGFFYWDELGCLARALGFHAEMFSFNIPDNIIENQNGVEYKELMFMINVQKYFHKSLDRTANIHTDEWNLSALKKSVPLIDRRILSFSELHAVRAAYQVYEVADTKGMMVDQNTLQRCLKMCGRMISPLKMLHRVKHMRENFEEPDRIQLHEFLDLILWCEFFEEISVTPSDVDITKDKYDMYKLDDFENILSHHDDRLKVNLDRQYRKEEWKFSKEKHGSKKMPKDIPPVDPEVRKNQVNYHNSRYKHLRDELSTSMKTLYQTKAGYVRERPISAPDLSMYEATEYSATSVPADQRETSMMEMAGYLIKPWTKLTSREVEERICKPTLPEYMRPLTAPTVTDDDKQQTVANIDALKFEQETMVMKYQQELNEGLDFMIPGYRGRRKEKPREEPPKYQPKTKQKVVERPSDEMWHKLANPSKRVPPPTHAKTCDARFRGWNPAKTKRGHHFIMSTPNYESDMKGQLLTKMYNQYAHQSKHGDFMYRHTSRGQIMPDQPPRRYTNVTDGMNYKAQEKRKTSEFSLLTEPSGGKLLDPAKQKEAGEEDEIFDRPSLQFSLDKMVSDTEPSKGKFDSPVTVHHYDWHKGFEGNRPKLDVVEEVSEVASPARSGKVNEPRTSCDSLNKLPTGRSVSSKHMSTHSRWTPQSVSFIDSAEPDAGLYINEFLRVPDECPDWMLKIITREDRADVGEKKIDKKAYRKIARRRKEMLSGDVASMLLGQTL